MIIAALALDPRVQFPGEHDRLCERDRLRRIPCRCRDRRTWDTPIWQDLTSRRS